MDGADVSRYAHREREQRWLLESVPSGSERLADIIDWYVAGTRLRVRRVEHGETVALKFAQKVRSDPTDPETVTLTNIPAGAGGVLPGQDPTRGVASGPS